MSNLQGSRTVVFQPCDSCHCKHRSTCSPHLHMRKGHLSNVSKCYRIPCLSRTNISYIMHIHTLIMISLDDSVLDVTLMVPLLDSEMGCTGKFWSKTNLFILHYFVFFFSFQATTKKFEKTKVIFFRFLKLSNSIHF